MKNMYRVIVEILNLESVEFRIQVIINYHILNQVWFPLELNYISAVGPQWFEALTFFLLQR